MSRRQVLAGLGALAVTSGTVGAARRGVFEPATVGARPERLGTPTRHRWRATTIGTSVEGRPILMHANVDPAPRFTVMVVSALHGDERGVGAFGQSLTGLAMPPGVSCYAVPIANPDGWHHGTRNNANDVDLNRNFPYEWRRHDGGPAPLSEPESRALASTVEAIRPSLVIWVHEPYGYVAPIAGTAHRYAAAWADAAGLPVRAQVRQHGGGETWAAEVAGCASMLVEGATRDATPEEVGANQRGFGAVLASI